MLARILLALVLTAGCASAGKIVAPLGEDDPLPTGRPEAAGLDLSSLEEISQELARSDDHAIHSILVVRNGLLVFEEYYNGYTRANPHDIRSATKSITSLLTGIAIDRGTIASVDDPLMDYLRTDYPDVRDKDDILLRHLLTMSSGLDCDDGDRGTRGQEDRMYRSKDWVDYFLSLSRAYAPGDTTRYCTGGVVALGEAIAQSADQDLAAFADDALFSPLGIRNYRWARFDDGQKVDAGGHLLLTPQAMAKIGMLVLQEGEWNGAQVVPAEWIEHSIRPRTKIRDTPYGFLWWSATLRYGEKAVEVVFASGNGGQTIFIAPEYNLVTVFTAGYYNSDRTRVVFEIFSNVVLPSVRELQAYLPNRP